MERTAVLRSRALLAKVQRGEQAKRAAPDDLAASPRPALQSAMRGEKALF